MVVFENTVWIRSWVPDHASMPCTSFPSARLSLPLPSPLPPNQVWSGRQQPAVTWRLLKCLGLCETCPDRSLRPRCINSPQGPHHCFPIYHSNKSEDTNDCCIFSAQHSAWCTTDAQLMTGQRAIHDYLVILCWESPSFERPSFSEHLTKNFNYGRC